MKLQSAIVSALLLGRYADAFTTRPVVSSSSTTRIVVGPLNVGAVMDWNESDLDESFLMQRAEAYANSAQASLEELRTALDDVIHVQSGCVSGSVLGDVCDNVGAAAELVANLRQKIQQKSKEVAKYSITTKKNKACRFCCWCSHYLLLSVCFSLKCHEDCHEFATISLAAMALAALASGLSAAHVDASPFTPQEVWWSIRDGYFPDLLSQYFRHGGLATLDYESETTPFVMQEWWWALKGGYLNNMVNQYFQNGGLATAEGFRPDATHFTANEWLSAANGGYVNQMMSENFKNGGLAIAERMDVESLAVTPREVFWAVRDGYCSDLVSHVVRNGGV
eukprot:CAMPEP_0176144282 /NCGR_PEP_ID=MMETSP0120_2-20121206/73457_1 /TAXON_ID=160619 /ORGANISM="Kryptoperidinium foliaceum, Strain CCMP 1326" /LENGTH=336 /DNA_ID=CAMNT_0017480647 /DNA_START=70 /DNA_END=1082 /DNA_ORIENTATION=-